MFNFFGSRGDVPAKAELKKYARFKPSHQREAAPDPKETPVSRPAVSAARRSENQFRTAQALARTKARPEPADVIAMPVHEEPSLLPRLSGEAGGLSPAVLRACLPGRFQT